MSEVYKIDSHWIVKCLFTKTVAAGEGGCTCLKGLYINP